MNAKLCKRLRRAAEDISVGQPRVVYTKRAGMVRLDPSCTRAVYHGLKKAAK